eukprot:1057959-Rhodomonas_salina.1
MERSSRQQQGGGSLEEGAELLGSHRCLSPLLLHISDGLRIPLIVGTPIHDLPRPLALLLSAPLPASAAPTGLAQRLAC